MVAGFISLLNVAVIVLLKGTLKAPSTGEVALTIGHSPRTSTKSSLAHPVNKTILSIAIVESRFLIFIVFVLRLKTSIQRWMGISLYVLYNYVKELYHSHFYGLLPTNTE